MSGALDDASFRRAPFEALVAGHLVVALCFPADANSTCSRSWSASARGPVHVQVRLGSA